MAPPKEKAQCVSWFIETKLDVQTQRKYKVRKRSTTTSTNRAWPRKFMETSQCWIKKEVGDQEHLRKTSIG